MHCMTFHKKKILIVFFACFGMMAVLAGRLVYLMIFESEYYQELAQDLHERERSIKAARGRIVDRTGTVLADNRTVCTISVIHSQIEDPEAVIQMLCKELGLSEETVRSRVEKVSSIERIQSNVDKEVGDAIRAYHYAGVKVDEDFKRYYPYDELASKVLGFTGSDNQGIIGLEVMYDEYLEGIPGTILTLTDARGIEIEDEEEEKFVNSLFLLTWKPVIFAANVAEEDLADDGASNDYVKAVREYAAESGCGVFVISARIEEEIAELDDAEKAEYLETLGLTESGLDKLIRASYDLLGLMSFLTAGEKETRAWTIKKGTKAPQAAGKIHSDFERGFIRAEVINYQELLDCGSLAAAKEKGLVRLEGKDYVVQDGDTILFRFNV